jgi:NAD(P)-dependent dehydrogenase (short-subunit alcohol dehydrogenase family)
VAKDCGKLVNPLIADGQVHGEGIAANTVSLGLVETDYDKEWFEANREKPVKLYPMRRLGQAGDVAPMVAMLVSPKSGWITGRTLSIRGGFSMA